MADIVIVNPRFDISFWGFEHCMPLFGKNANLPVACLGLLAALVPDHHDVTLIDENVEDIDFDRLGRADLVCLTGMSIQGARLIEILAEVRARGVMTVVGGPMATVEPEVLEGLTDVLFLGEADETWPEFLAAWEKGTHKTRYEQAEKTDVAKLPLPRNDLLKANRYMFGSMQISRGCPFTCEFCDIIVTFGRRPRLKESAQVIAELESFLKIGLKMVFVVDDNLIGNKKAIKPILRDIAEWQQARGYPLTLFTEASLDLAEDEELMELMGLASFQNVFIGIETPNEESLRETKKLQNVRPNAGSLVDRVHRIQNHGIDVWCGMIVGFDNDDTSIFKAIPQFLSRARISTALVGMLHAIPTTPLHKRLKEAGRLNNAEEAEFYGTNVEPLGMSREELRDGFIQVMQESYAIDAYFERLDSQFIDQDFKFTVHELPYWSNWRWAWAKRASLNYVRFIGIAWRLLGLVKDRVQRARYRSQLVQVARKRWREPHILFIYALKTATHYHFAELARSIADVDPETGAMSDAGRSFSRARNVEAEAAEEKDKEAIAA
ncbi:MAG: radical SAM protein [Pseudomonadota bacterium]